MTCITLTLAVLLTLYLLWEWYASHMCPICGKKGKHVSHRYDDTADECIGRI